MNVRSSAAFAPDAFVIFCLGVVYVAGLTVRTLLGCLASLPQTVKSSLGGRQPGEPLQR